MEMGFSKQEISDYDPRVTQQSNFNGNIKKELKYNVFYFERSKRN